MLVPVVFFIWAAVRGQNRGGTLFSDLRRRTLYPALAVALSPAVGAAFIPGTPLEKSGAAAGVFALFAFPSITALILFGLPGTLWLAHWRPPLGVALLVVLGVGFAGGWLLLSLVFGAEWRAGFIDLSGVPLFGGIVGFVVALAWIAFNHRLLRDTLSAPREPAERPIYPRTNEADG